jgi:lactoylglutathione lyase
MNLGYAIVFVSDMERSVSFYRDVVGLPLRFESPEWSEFATGGATLALHRSDSPRADRPRSRLEPAGCCRPGFSASDLDAFHRRMVENGVPCLREPEEIFGTRIAQYADPDGLAFSVGEDRT